MLTDLTCPKSHHTLDMYSEKRSNSFCILHSVIWLMSKLGNFVTVGCGTVHKFWQLQLAMKSSNTLLKLIRPC